ncbi:peptidylprolyl isomerase [Tissierella sp. Yu-01]|uniref:peptidylprolyl isomerase n=1 Tax=Tissierella sp. Yu-01 TaxID=3035694 RepID=UPI00240CFA4C|nr:peptidylprolyl isomerase [Tissierella sp. Yu-01]WFA09377.1 peptidylprolyl isomerase [Tissierella sp. Yu-01]
MSENNLVAKVNGKEISKDDVLKFLNDIGPQMAMQFQSPEGIKRVIDELVNQELLYLDAIELNLEEDKEFKDVLEKTKANLLKDYAVNKIIAGITTKEEELKDYYEKNKDSYNKPESVKASHILVDNEDKANEVISELNEGLSFEDAAKNYSTCPSKEAGGALGEFTKGQMVKEFEDVAFNMEVGTVSKPVKTQFGYHIIKLTDKNKASISNFEEVKDQVNNQVLRIKQQKEYLSKIDTLKGKYEVEVF